MNKPKDPIDEIAPPEERQKCLRDYPYVGSERKEGRVYLEDYYDRKAFRSAERCRR